MSPEAVGACAALVERGDADRFAAVMAAPLAVRGRLFVLYAFNLEVARAPWVTQEPMIAEMRLQWWRDVLAEAAEGRAPRGHEVAGPLHALIRGTELPVAVLDRLVEARRRDIWREPFADEAELGAYLEDTAGGLLWAAGRCLGAVEADEAALRDLGWAAGLASYLQAVPELLARGRQPLVRADAAGIAAMAEAGLDRLAQARARLGTIAARAQGATLAGWQAGGLLRLARAEPERVLRGELRLSEFRRRGGLLLAGWRGRL
ncbi:squalene/phytoene synthase family protein [Rhodobacter sp. HX-7-19]|uniref:Squalene/phytoene synthase family protein n=1 Tax=Paragemmobacter kunshanensis TaxID=2583234 RepID=A0A6M1U6P3_9RHOB|nr:squalene/phytoene synthase family protein [Rhodobacter kunshanensis]NGQ92035.1 squalene/phytoene synthase family protein [Rhodobacter kunshanensis]